MLFAAFAPLQVQVAMCISFVELPFLSSRLASWLASDTRDNRTGRKNVMEWIKIPGNLLPAQDYHILISAELALNVFAMHANYLSSAVELACPPI